MGYLRVAAPAAVLAADFEADEPIVGAVGASIGCRLTIKPGTFFR